MPVAGSDLQGAVRLGGDAVRGVADLVEALHRQIARPRAAAPRAGEPARLGGIGGLVYGSVRGINALAGSAAEILLAALTPVLPRLGPGAPAPEREAIVAILNGVLGDRLQASGNPLAVRMALRSRGRALRLAPASLAAHLRNPSGRLLVLVHGLCMNDLMWQREGHDHGAALARDLGVTPVYLHYNSGLPVAVNGRAFGDQMQVLLDHWPVPLREVSILTHSMGGLVARSAALQAEAAGQDWQRRLARLLFLGTPHHGAPLERGGHWIDLLLGVSRYSAPFARLSRLRSAGITDLRHGSVWPAPPDASGRARAVRDTRRPAPLPAGVACYALASLRGERSAAPGRDWLGDGLVPLASALGRHDDPRHALAFPAERQRIVEGVHHLQLLNDPAVYAQLRHWMAEPRPA